MIKIGDKVKFDEYLPHNYMTNQILRVTLGSKKKLYRREIMHQRLEHITKYKSILIKENIPLEGIYVGPFYKKLVRSYKRSEPKEVIFRNPVFRNPAMIDPFEERESILRSITDFQRIDRPTTNPRRIDDPRSLNKMAMIKIGRRLIGVPMTNVMKCNFGNTLKVL